jgi:quercetin dioxygenase-like cupin family protein
MRTLVLGLAGALVTLPAAAILAPTNPIETVHIFKGSSIPSEPFAEWEVKDEHGTRVQLAQGKEAVDKAPANAVRYEVKTVSYPTGTIREFRFKKATGGVLHMTTVETELYVLKGSAEVGVGKKREKLAAGDGVSMPSGVLRSVGTPEDTVIIAWTVGSSVPNPKAMVVRGKDVKAEMTGEWDEDGKVKRTGTTAETNKQAPKDARRLLSKRYEFDGNSLRVAHLYKGANRSPAKTTTDSLIYVTEGPIIFHQEKEVMEVNPGDFIHEEAGLTHIWEQVHDGGFVTTTGYPVIPVKK